MSLGEDHFNICYLVLRHWLAIQEVSQLNYFNCNIFLYNEEFGEL